MKRSAYTREILGYLAVWAPLCILRIYLPECGLSDGRVHGIVAGLGWACSRTITRAYHAAVMHRYNQKSMLEPFTHSEASTVSARKAPPPLAQSLLSANLNLGAHWVTHHVWPHARVIQMMKGRQPCVWALVLLLLVLCIWNLSMRARLWLAAATLWFGGVWMMALVDSYWSLHNSDNNAGLIIRRDSASGQLVELQQIALGHPHGIHWTRNVDSHSWSKQSYWFRSLHGQQVIRTRKPGYTLVRTWQMNKLAGWQGSFTAAGVRTTTVLWNDSRLVLIRHDPPQRSSYLSFTMYPWAKHIVLPFVRRWRMARTMRAILLATDMCNDVSRLVADYAVDLHAVHVPDASCTLHQLLCN
jgi:hypothetical protein